MILHTVAAAVIVSQTAAAVVRQSYKAKQIIETHPFKLCRMVPNPAKEALPLSI